jgi:cyanophycinase-like exopeptidase
MAAGEDAGFGLPAGLRFHGTVHPEEDSGLHLLKSCSRTAAIVLSLAASSGLQPASATYEYFHAGKAEGVHPHTAPGFLLAGGGNTPDEAYRWFVDKAAGGDAITIRASGADAMNKVLLDAGTLNSASTLLFHDRDASSDPTVVKQIREASALFIAGGDQWNYFRMWRGTPAGEAINDLIRRGVPVGGTSAGLAVLGEFGFSAEHDSVTSSQALANPFDQRIAIADDFIHIPILRGIITDTHFVKRDRMGRTLAFLARLVQDKRARPARAIAVDEGNAVLLESSGAARLSGKGAAYFLELAGDAPPAVCEAEKPLTVRQIAVYRVGAGSRFDVKKWKGENGTAYTLSVENGVIHSTQAGNGIY